MYRLYGRYIPAISDERNELLFSMFFVSSKKALIIVFSLEEVTIPDSYLINFD